MAKMNITDYCVKGKRFTQNQLSVGEIYNARTHLFPIINICGKEQRNLHWLNANFDNHGLKILAVRWEFFDDSVENHKRKRKSKFVIISGTELT